MCLPGDAVCFRRAKTSFILKINYMKTIILVVAATFAIGSLTFESCNTTPKQVYNSNESVATSPGTSEATSTGRTKSTATRAVDPLVNSYLKLKNALVLDNSPSAAAAGTYLAEEFASFDPSKLSATQQSSFKDIADDAREMAEHIGKSAGNLPHQREHFDMLSTDMVDLVKLLGPGQPLYVARCPMYNDKKGAIWLSEVKEIKNPYMGNHMATCGAITQELK